MAIIFKMLGKLGQKNDKKNSNKKIKELEVGVNVRVSILGVDRAKGSPRNLLASTLV
jgi:hypothetical protein